MTDRTDEILVALAETNRVLGLIAEQLILLNNPVIDYSHVDRALQELKDLDKEKFHG